MILYFSRYVFMFRAPVIPEFSLQMDNLAIFDHSMLVKGKDTITTQDIECFKYWFGKQCKYWKYYVNSDLNNLSIPTSRYKRRDLPSLNIGSENKLLANFTCNLPIASNLVYEIAWLNTYTYLII